jgi:hypothetical protein
VLQRAADLYQLRPEILWAQVQNVLWGGAGPIDAPSEAGLATLSEVLGLSHGRVRRLMLPDGDEWLVSGPREAYCMRCWQADDAAGRARHFRRAWRGVFAVNCAEHSLPLMAWHAQRDQYAPRRDDDLSMASFFLEQLPAQPAVAESLEAIRTLASVMQQCFFGDGRWPTHWTADATTARALLVHVMTPGGGADAQWLSRVYAPPALRPFVHPGPTLGEGSSVAGWERLRQTFDPAVRRMALWLVGNWLDPAWPYRSQTPTPPLDSNATSSRGGVPQAQAKLLGT